MNTTRIERGYAHVGWVTLLFSAACGGNDVTELPGAGAVAANVGDFETAHDSPTPFAEPLEADLEVGSRGAAVRAVYEALREHGYFPNDELRDLYPAWRPIIERAPGNPDVFDEQTASAVAAFQRISGLSETGSVDAETWARLGALLCGVPEGIARPDPSQKYDFNGGKWNKTTIIWKVVNVTNSGLSINDVRTQVARAFGSWDAASELSFSEAQNPMNIPTPPPPDIEIKFGPWSGNVAARASAPDDGGNDKGGDITLDNSDRIWSIDATVSTGETDLETVLVHEIGHTLGLAHSGVFLAAMSRDGGTTIHPINRSLASDDKMAIRALYGTWHSLGVAAANTLDIAAGGDGTDSNSDPEVWILGGSSVAGGSRVYRKNGGDWQQAPNQDGTLQGGIAIGVAKNGQPWIVADTGNIYRYSTSIGGTGLWQQIPGPLPGRCAIDVGVSGATTGSASVWVIGCDGLIYRWSGGTTGNPWDAGTPGFASRIAVDSSKNPWITAEDHTIWRRNGATGNWEEMPCCATDVGVGPKDYAVVISDHDAGGYTWNEQAGGTDGEFPPVARFDWVSLPGNTLRAVSVGPNGAVWAVGQDNRIYHFGVQ